ncbi:MAG: S8 family serine peptidase [Phycisphaerales bacterium]|nr:MAG: S8 family serine peptidase [Phycisphaerales bacterium]
MPDNQPVKGYPAIPAVVRHKLRGEHHPERLLVRFRPGRGQREQQATHQIARAKRVVTSFRLVDGLQLVEVDADHLAASLAAYAGSPDVLYAEPDFIVHADVVPNDPLFGFLWGMRNVGQSGGTPGADIRATDAWDLWIGDPNFRIAVIDTGVNYNHPDLGPNIWANPGEIPGNGIDDEGNGYIDDVHGYDFINNDGDPMDDHYHGSHTAGTIGAVGNNSEGVVGVNWQCKIVALKFLGAGASGPISDAMEALQYAIEHDIKVSNNSWSGGNFSQAMYDTIQASQAIDHVFVAAAANNAWDLDATPRYPASYDLPNIITVAATDRNDDLASFSNWGLTGVDLGAPGVSVYSTVLGTDYAYASGTSMAAPHVAGVVALLMSRDPTLSWQVAKDRILESTRPVASLAGLTVTGGVLDAVAALGDCNANGIDDAVDIATGASEDCTGNGTPDECEPDCNDNSIADSCDIAAGTSEDCDGLGTPDECEPDCNTNGVADRCDISSGASEDCNVDGVPDECQPGGTEDCDENGRTDLCDLFLGLAFDCNQNDVPDACDLLLGASEDCNENLIPDECDVTSDVLLSGGDAGWDFVESIADLGYRVARVDRDSFPADLSSFEVVILGPGGVPYDSTTVGDIDEFVAAGGAMIRIQDSPDYHVQYGGEARPMLDAEGWAKRANTQVVDPGHPLAAGLPATSTLTGYSAVYTLKPEAEVVLAWDDGEAMTVYYPYGDGKVIYFNDLWAAYVYLWEGDTEYGLALMENALNEARPPGLDCNRNGNPDACDLASETSEDCTGNGIPDECEPDCNGNLVADVCDIDAGTSEDCTGNGVPDECEPDCNGNLVADVCDIDAGNSEDCNVNGIPDDCEPDCNGNLVADSCDIAAGISEDCNVNGIPDECEADCNGNLIPDDCDVTPDALVFAGNAEPGFVESIADMGYRIVSMDDNPFPSDLSSYEVVIFGPAGVPHNPLTVSAIDEFVANGGGMIRIQDAPLSNTQYSGDARPILDAEGWAVRSNTEIVDPTSPLAVGLTTTSTLTGYSAVYTLKPEASVAIAWEDGEAMTVIYEYGDGKVIYFNDFWAAYSHLWEGDTAYGLTLMQNALNETKAPELDCNRNSNPDACDIASGFSEDCSGNGIPDECEPDCNGTLIADSCDLVAGTSEDCSGNGIPDECEPDCNDNLVADSCDIVAETSEDCTGNWTPDECEPDCNENGVADSCDILDGTSNDVNGNGQPDECGLVLYVDLNATGQGTGLTWADAFTDLQQGLAMASSLSVPDGDLAIWIAAGTYTPSFRTDPADPRTATFQLVNDVHVYGGFAGDETSLAGRDVRSNVVVLTGDLSGDDGPDFANNAENAYHVVTGSNANSNAVLDGVTITGGFAYEGTSGDRAQGAGVIIDGGSATLVDCTITANRAFIGAGMLVRAGGSTIANCTFAGNQAGTRGGGIENVSSNILVVNSIFSGNTAGDDPDYYGRGAGLSSNGTANVVVTNCVFVGNHAFELTTFGQGGGLCSYGSSVTTTVTNCVFWDNTVGGTGTSDFAMQIASLYGAVINVDFSCVFGWDSSLGGVGNTGSVPQFVDSDGPDDVWGTLDDDFHLNANSPCIDAGDNAAVPPDLVDLDGDSDFAEPLSLDLDGNPRFADHALTPDSGNGAPPIVDMGVYELGSCGNGVVDFGEACDDGGESAECDVDCTLPVCGDETVNATAGEACDDGFTDDCGTCNAECTGPGTGSVCGDGETCPETEDCDDGDTDEGDGCSSSCTIESGFACVGEPSVCGSDCSGNGIPDECDLDCSALAGMCNVIGCGQSADGNTNGIPDECELVPPALPSALRHQARKHRYISIDPSSNAANEVAYKVELVEMMRCDGDLRRTCSIDADCPNVCDNDADITCTGDPACSGGTCVVTTPCVHHSDEGLTWWVQEPQQEALGCRLPGGCTDEDWFARLDTALHFQTWNDFGVGDSSLLHISDCQITPVATYAVSACAPPTGDLCSEPLVIGTILRPPPGNYGDVVGPVDPVTTEFDPPNQILSVGDISGYLLTNLNYGLPGDPKPQAHWTWVDMEGQGAPFYRPQAILNVGDLNQILFGLMGRPYSWAGNNVDPGDCP